MIEGEDFALRDFTSTFRFTARHVRCSACGAVPSQQCWVVTQRPSLKQRVIRRDHVVREYFAQEVKDWLINEALHWHRDNAIIHWENFVNATGVLPKPARWIGEEVSWFRNKQALSSAYILLRWIDYIAKQKLKGTA